MKECSISLSVEVGRMQKNKTTKKGMPNIGKI